MLARLLAWGLLLLILGYSAMTWLHASTVQAEVPAHIQILLPADDCLAPCWQGIRPGITTFKETHNLIAGWPGWENTAQMEWQSDRHDLIVVQSTDALNLFPANVTLGEWITYMGAPDYYVISLSDGLPGRGEITPYRPVRFYYAAAQLFVIVQLPRTAVRLTPDLMIDSIMYTKFEQPECVQPWQGFVRVTTTPTFAQWCA